MQKSLLILLVLAIVGCAIWLLRDPAQQAPPADGSSPLGAAPAELATGDPPAEREVHTPEPTVQVLTAVEVLVQLEDGTPVDGRAVSLVDTDPDSPYLAHVLTNERGVAAFEVRVDDTRLLAAFVAGDGELWFELRAGEPTRRTLTLPVELRVEGRVVDAQGRGVADAELVYLPWSVRLIEGLPRVTVVGTTSADGSFSVPLPSGGKLGAWHRRFAPSPMALVERPDGVPRPARITLELTLLTDPGRLEGTVLDGDGRPVAGAAVELCSFAGETWDAALEAPPLRLWTDDEGRFATHRVRQGLVRFEAIAAGRGCARGHVTVTDYAARPLEIRLQTPAAVYGTVCDPEGNALPGARVQFGRPGDLLSKGAETDAEGSYRLADLPPGRERLEARAGGDVAGEPGSLFRVGTTLTLASGAEVECSPRLGPAAGSRLHWLVVDEQERGLPRWTVLARQGDGAVQHTATDREGRFVFRARGDAPFDVLVYPPGSRPAAFAAAAARAIAPRADPYVLTAHRATPRSAVTGRVEGPAGRPLPAEVTCRHAGLDQSVRTLAGEDGTFRFADVPAGAISVTAAHPGHVEVSRDGAVAAGIPLDLGTLALEPGSAVYGTVTALDGTLPADLQIAIQAGERRLTARCAGGSYRFDAVPPGRHRLLVQGTGIAAASSAIEVPARAEFVKDFVVARGFERTIRIEAPESEGRQISLALQAAGKPYCWIADQQCSGGGVEFTAWMAPGPYEAIAWDDDGRQAIKEVQFAVGALPPVELRLGPR